MGFADGYALLVVSEPSLAALNARLARPVPLDRFRANVVVRGCEPFAEDGWGEFSVGAARLMDQLYALLSRFAADPSDFYHLPRDRVVELGERVAI